MDGAPPGTARGAGARAGMCPQHHLLAPHGGNQGGSNSRDAPGCPTRPHVEVKQRQTGSVLLVNTLLLKTITKSDRLQHLYTTQRLRAATNLCFTASPHSQGLWAQGLLGTRSLSLWGSNDNTWLQLSATPVVPISFPTNREGPTALPLGSDCTAEMLCGPQQGTTPTRWGKAAAGGRCCHQE